MHVFHLLAAAALPKFEVCSFQLEARSFKGIVFVFQTFGTNGCLINVSEGAPLQIWHCLCDIILDTRSWTRACACSLKAPGLSHAIYFVCAVILSLALFQAANFKFCDCEKLADLSFFWGPAHRPSHPADGSESQVFLL